MQKKGGGGAIEGIITQSGMAGHPRQGILILKGQPTLQAHGGRGAYQAPMSRRAAQMLYPGLLKSTHPL